MANIPKGGLTQGFGVDIQGDEELIKKFQSMAKDFAAGVLEESALAGAEKIAERANSLAPGPFIEIELDKKTRDYATVKIGPDEEHWYYRFFETGVGPHEITPEKTGGLQFPGAGGEAIVRVIASHQGMGAKPFLLPAFDEKIGQAKEATGQKFLDVINKHVERS